MEIATRDIWLAEAAGESKLRAFGLRVSRVLVLTARGFHQHRAMVQAAALTYYTVLSIVPMLAVSFAVARGLGAYEQLKNDALIPFLNRYLGGGDAAEAGAELGPQADGMGQLRSAVDQIIALVDGTNDLPLGMFGLALLLYTAVKLLSAVERSLNDIWGILHGRSLARRFSDYIAIVVVTPILLLVGTASTTALRTLRLKSGVGDVEVDLSGFMTFVLQAAPLAVIWLGLTFAYFAMPNTRVRISSAAMGGAAAAGLWLVSQFAYVELQIGIANYNGLYAGFAALPIFLFWVFFSWVIFLIGAELSYAHHSVPLYTSIARMGTVDHAFRESLALRLCGRIADLFLSGERPESAAELAADLEVAPRAVNQVLEHLITAGILVRTGDRDDDFFLPARDLELVTVLDVLGALKQEEGSQPLGASTRLDQRVDRILEGLEGEARASLHNYTLRELALAAHEPTGSGAEGDEAVASEPNPQGSSD